MRKVMIIGSAMTKFGRHMDRNLKSLALEAVNGALKDAGITKEQLQGAWVGSPGILSAGGRGTLGRGRTYALGRKDSRQCVWGLESQGHPIGATGIGQVVELTWHLTGRAGKRQVEKARVGLAQNAGGTVGGSGAALSVTILKK
jgi:acetyl-CoA acetyltransferase